ncbi:MAG TPA: LanC-like protein [Burkholderiaceae bacterium]|nr:LanC-like protein [Burkholderiaceae bacterium]
MLFRPDRHEPLNASAWSEGAAREAIRAIVGDACRSYRADTLWPAHPRDIEDGHPGLPMPSLYDGAAGALWALRYLAARGAAEVSLDLGAAIAGLHEHSRRYIEASGMERASYFLGESGVLLLQWTQQRSAATADALFELARGNLRNPAREALWGSPGTLVAVLHLLEASGEPRWQALLREGVAILWDQMHAARHTSQPDREAWIWTQDLYGQQVDYMGAGHGFAGNVFPVLRGARWLDAEVVAAFEARAAETLAIAASHEEGRVNWEPFFDPVAKGYPSKPLVQDCHGAPGIVCRLASARPPALHELLIRAGELVWAAGPLTKPPGLCHGTDGNGYAFLKLHAMTGEARWLERARAFAMHAIRQSDALAELHGQRRFTLWTGDLGLAVYLWACIAADPALPTLDVF